MQSKLVQVIIDRPIGYVDKFNNVYPVNYGYIPGIIGGDGEEQDVYVLDFDYPIDKYQGKVVAVVHRNDDVETKWIVSNQKLSKAEIMKKVYFMEQYFDSEIQMFEE